MVELPPRRAVLGGRAEVLVVGGGPAGLGSALGAAAAGADVVLAERYALLGGNATVALVMPLMSFHNEKKQAAPGRGARLPPTDHGEGDPVVAGVRLPFHAFASGLADGQDGRRVVFETKSGPVAIDARVVVDCTGDGDLAAAAGAPFEVGRPEDGHACRAGRPTRSRCAACSPAASTISSSPAAACPAPTSLIPPTGSCPSRWPPARPRAGAPRWPPAPSGHPAPSPPAWSGVSRSPRARACAIPPRCERIDHG